MYSAMSCCPVFSCITFVTTFCLAKTKENFAIMLYFNFMQLSVRIKSFSTPVCLSHSSSLQHFRLWHLSEEPERPKQKFLQSLVSQKALTVLFVTLYLIYMTGQQIQQEVLFIAILNKVFWDINWGESNQKWTQRVCIASSTCF